MFDDAIPETTTRELPIADYGHLPKQIIESSVSGLDRDQAETLLRYECAHRDRTPVVRLLTARLRQLRERAVRRGWQGGGSHRAGAERAS